MAKVTITPDEAKKLATKKFDWDKFDELTPEEVHEAALDDPDAQPLTEEQLKKFKPAVPRGNGVYANEKKNNGSEQRPSKDNSGKGKGDEN